MPLPLLTAQQTSAKSRKRKTNKKRSGSNSAPGAMLKGGRSKKKLSGKRAR